MYLENLVIDSVEPQQLGRFWEAVVGGERLTDKPGIYETRYAVPGGPEIDLCFQQVPDRAAQPPRLHLDLTGDTRQTAEVERLLALGAQYLDLGQGDVGWVVLADPEGNACCVLEERPAYVGSGPIAALPLASADPDRDAAFWAWLTGWTPTDGDAPRSLRHPSGLGPLLELIPEAAPKDGTKNRMHFDVRLEDDDDADETSTAITAHGGREVHPPWADDVPWRLYQDPSGNEFCVLPVSR
ncbi:MAG: glyoxalase/bleomycin resistance/dioxygenase family protein [Marmoricola sp.]|nr:glyoxalase/bleomycin resistance/dioxygenase family protein [Marmoricola sp.]